MSSSSSRCLKCGTAPEWKLYASTSCHKQLGLQCTFEEVCETDERRKEEGDYVYRLNKEARKRKEAERHKAEQKALKESDRMTKETTWFEAAAWRRRADAEKAERAQSAPLVPNMLGATAACDIRDPP